MILINHPHIHDIAAQYADALFKKFEAKKNMINHIVNILGNQDDYERNIQPMRGVSAIRLLLGEDFEVPSGKTLNDKADILYHNIERYRASSALQITCAVNINRIKEQLEIIFTFDSLKKLFSEEIDQLKGLNESFINGGVLHSDVYAHFFDYTKYYITLNKYIGQELGIICCPYCNRNYISYVFSPKGKIIGPTYDHFFNKKTYKYIALSFFNLIPSCTICNSNLKNAIDFDLTTHLYPYRDDFGKNAFFDFDLKLVDTSEEKKIIFRPTIVLAKDISPEDELKLMGGKDKKGEGSIKVFRLREIYETHYDTVEEVYQKFSANNPYYAQSIKKNLDLLGVGKEEFYRFHFHNYYDSSDFHRRPLAKLTKDIYTKMEQVKKDTSTGI